MVLQRGVAVPVWGNSAPGADVLVEFAGQKAVAKAGADGRWKATLRPLEARAKPGDLTVTAGGETQVLRDILVGDVWIAAGQSNMEWTLANEAHAKEELPQADRPALRLLNLSYAGQNANSRPFGPEVLKRLDSEHYFRGAWTRCSTESAKPFSAVAYYFGKELLAAARVPVGVVHLAVGGSPTEAWIRKEVHASSKELRPMTEGNWLANELLEPWCRQRARENLGRHTESPHPFQPGFLWEAGVAKLLPFPIRGVIWYQGESNSLSLPRVRQHELLFPLMVADWRKQWGIGNFPFLYCQLSSIGTSKGYKSEYWPEFRDSQRRMLERIPESAMAVTSDLGHPTDVHPRNKRDVGHRLALAALATVYGQVCEHRGPDPASTNQDGSTLVVRFRHADGLTTSDGKPPRSFELAGADGKYNPVEAMIEGTSVRLKCGTVAAPVSVRYGWQPVSEGNLVNRAALPASTFQLKVSP
jgi:sialate O-acetylesterase